jgi:hypothetical protein
MQRRRRMRRKEVYRFGRGLSSLPVLFLRLLQAIAYSFSSPCLFHIHFFVFSKDK